MYVDYAVKFTGYKGRGFMCRVKQGSCLILFSMLLPVLLACGNSSLYQSGETFPYSTFRDIPGITHEEIAAVEAIIKQRDYFVYGMLSSTEAFYAHDGTIRGFAALFADWLSDFFGIPFKIGLFEWGDIIAGLQSGRIDFAGDLTATEERLKKYYMTDTISVRPLKYTQLQGSANISEIIQSRPLRSAFLRGSTIINQITEYFEPGGYELVLIDDNTSIYDLLVSGEADVYFYESTEEAVFDVYDGLIFHNFIPMVIGHVSMTAQNPLLRPIISVVQKALRNGNNHHLALLYNQGHREYLKNKLFMRLTDDEKEFIQTNPVVLVAAENDNYPISFYNVQEGQWQGIVFELMSEIEMLTGLSFKIVNASSADRSAIKRMLEDGEASMITELIRSEELEGRFLWAESRIMTDFFALLSRAELRNINISEILYMRVGLPKYTAYAEVFNNWFPFHEFTVEYETLDMAFNALNQGEIDLVMSSNHQFLILTNFRELPGYKINVAFDQTFDSTFGFNINETELSSIVDKALRFIDIHAISDQWMHRTYDYRVKLAQAQMPWLVGATALFLGLLFMFIMLIRHRNQGLKLETLVKKRTEELHISQFDLQTTLEKARAASFAKSAFLANMSHEIRTPMNSIVGFSELALDGELTPKTQDYLKKILSNAEWLLQIINDILDISKIESGKMELERIPFDIHELFSSCRSLVIPKAVEKGIMLHFYAEPSIGRKPVGDPTRLRQVFVNLLSNAIKFANTGMVKLLSEIVDTDENSITMHFEIKDSGIGMTPEQIERIFDPFTQAETGTTRKYGGTGLGLAITKNIVEQMGGKLSVESTPGVGSKFSFDLTLETINITEEEKRIKKIGYEKIEKPFFDGEILLCEDNVMNQQVICEHLARIGLKTVVAENGKVGVEIVTARKKNNEKQFDLIFMDIHMPLMDGLDAAEKIIDLGVETPIIAMTANIMSDDMEVYKRSGMKDCVGKPFTSYELWQCLLKYLKTVNTDDTTRPGEDNLLTTDSQHEDDTLETDMEFQVSLLKLFVKNNANKYREINEALRTGDIKFAYILVHTLKSNAGQIGLMSLQKAAAKVENHLKDSKNLVEPRELALLGAELNDALVELQRQLAHIEEQHKELAFRTNLNDDEDSAVNEVFVRGLFEQLEQMLRLGNTACLNTIDKLRRIPQDEALKNRLIQQIEDFEFDQAMDTLAELKKTLKDAN